MKETLLSLLMGILCHMATTTAQSGYWQQSVDYRMDIDMNVKDNTFTGYQKLVYTNHSPDTLYRVFYHLYFNAFQPGSMMDVRSRNIPDPDRRVRDRISHLNTDEMGFQRILNLMQDSVDVDFQVEGTILEVTLAQPILPGSQSVLEMDFHAQVPIQIRRSGRDNKEGVRYSMTQWYPKLCEYDRQGWHADPYVGREFYGVWGDFDVRITIDPSYLLGGTGYLQTTKSVSCNVKIGNKKEVVKDKTLWHFKAQNVHDFAWAADPDFKHVRYQCDEGTEFHYLYQPGEGTKHWEALPEVMCKVLEYANAHYGRYPYRSYSVIQGGDGGMEYPMATLIRGERSFRSLIGVSVHEFMHSWYQGVLGTNESQYAWMDEGFTSYASTEIMNYLRSIGVFGDIKEEEFLFQDQIDQQIQFANSGYEEPMSLHADYFGTNSAYGMAAYTKGELLLLQLGYIIGDEIMHQGLRKYYEKWKFKHPDPDHFIRVMEKISSIELDWYMQYWINTTKTIDYGIDSVFRPGLFAKSTSVTLENRGQMPMPIDLLVTLKDGSRHMFNIPLRMMRGNKKKEMDNATYRVLPDWPWTNPTYQFELPFKWKNIQRIEIDPLHRTVDMNRNNNLYERVRS